MLAIRSLSMSHVRSAGNDLRRHRKLHQVQVHGLRRGLPGGLLLRRREHAGHPPDECIDCGVCEPECPAEAIKPDTEPGLEKWLSVNAEYAKTWPNITVKKEAPADAKEWDGKPDKFKKLFARNPGDWRLSCALSAAAAALTRLNGFTLRNA